VKPIDETLYTFSQRIDET